ncbi:hypothetical protein Taro_028322 [Colocasia esculenta]|uniref:Uncharacterized protein n=1 Tax=Colocasia esculenta TaxID=4460 RepID=A0A843VMS6_COLES|nr:hypothetical protein [Colocasia esculenta]
MSVKVVDTCFMTCGLLHWPGFIFKWHQLYWRRRLQDPRTTSSIWFHLQLQDLRETPSAWFHILETSVMLTPSASRPTGNSVGLVSSSGDVDYVDVDSFKTYGKLHRSGFIFWGRRLC